MTSRDAGAQSAKGEAAMIDFELSGGGTVYLLRPVSRAAHHWVVEHLPTDATWWCGARLLKERQEVVGKVETRRAEPFGSALQCCSVGSDQASVGYRLACLSGSKNVKRLASPMGAR